MSITACFAVAVAALLLDWVLDGGLARAGHWLNGESLPERRRINPATIRPPRSPSAVLPPRPFLVRPEHRRPAPNPTRPEVRRM